MRVLWSLHLYLPGHSCGSEMMAHHINRYLISKGHEVRVILHQSEMYNIACPYVYEGVEVFGATGHLDAYRWADIIFSHLDFTQYTLIVARAANRPLVHLVHNDIEYNCIVNAANGTNIVYNSEWIKNILNYKWPSVVMHPPCDSSYYDVDRTGAEAITLISLNKNKGGEFFYKLAEAMPDRKFIGVIGGYDSQCLTNVPDNVQIIGNSPDILSVYKRTRILLMPSLYESWGRTATEAMCSGIPVICTPTPGLKENCGNAAKYLGHKLTDIDPGEPQVHRGSVQTWVKAIKSLDSPARYEKYSLLSRKRAAELNPLKELEELESFLINAVNSYH